MGAGEGEQRRLSVMPGNYARKQIHEAVDNPAKGRTNVLLSIAFCIAICYNNDQYKRHNGGRITLKNMDLLSLYDRNQHSVYLLYYHLILVIKYRRKVLDDAVSLRAKEIFSYIAPSYGITLEEWNHDMDHVHVVFRAKPATEISRFINAYKSASSRLLKKEYPEIREKLWKEYFWSKSFCLITAGGAPVEVIRKYIESQGEKNR